MKLLVFGGTGFVGARVVHKALERGCRVVVVSRAGVPPPSTPLHQLALRARVVGGRAAAREAAAGGSVASAPAQQQSQQQQQQQGDNNNSSSSYSDDLTFVRLDATSRSQVFDFLHDHSDADAIVSCIGVLTCNYDVARRINADANVNIAAGVNHAQLVPRVRKYVYVSAEPMADYLPSVFDHRWTLKGYFQGKRATEKAMLDNLGTRAVVLRPGFIYGMRYVTLPLPRMLRTGASSSSTVIPAPLSLVGYPLDVVLRALHGYGLLTPPVHVDVLAETALRACVWAGQATHADVHGIVDVARMHVICNAADTSMTGSSSNEDNSAAATAATQTTTTTTTTNARDESASDASSRDRKTQ